MKKSRVILCFTIGFTCLCLVLFRWAFGWPVMMPDVPEEWKNDVEIPLVEGFKLWEYLPPNKSVQNLHNISILSIPGCCSADNYPDYLIHDTYKLWNPLPQALQDLNLNALELDRICDHLLHFPERSRNKDLFTAYFSAEILVRPIKPHDFKFDAEFLLGSTDWIQAYWADHRAATRAAQITLLRHYSQLPLSDFCQGNVIPPPVPTYGPNREGLQQLNKSATEWIACYRAFAANQTAMRICYLQLRLDAAHLRGEKPRLDQLATGEWLLDARSDKPLILDPKSGKVVAP
ncbi:MAG: hypothetical protein RL095_4156 [Verrucomicrobiota bacterium]|jgi:hypothetical protein